MSGFFKKNDEHKNQKLSWWQVKYSYYTIFNFHIAKVSIHAPPEQNEVCISTPSRRIESFIFIVAEQNDLNLIPYLTCNDKTDLIFSLLTQD